MLTPEELIEYDSSLFDIYLKFLAIQLRTEIETAEVSRQNNADSSGEHSEDEKKELDPEQKDRIDYLKKNLASNKYCFIFNFGEKKFIISKVHIQGIIVYKDTKESRVILGCIFYKIQ